MHKAVELVAFHVRRLLVDCRLLLSKKIGKEKIGSLYSLYLECAGIPVAAMAMVEKHPLNLMSIQAVNIARGVTQHMQIQMSYADAVTGTAGASISYIRRASGATVTIQETRGNPTEMTVEISGSASQVQTAQTEIPPKTWNRNPSQFLVECKTGHKKKLFYLGVGTCLS
ncbi:hypothetical protein TIFTF001_000974 [Ficus carica]|uniref:K Homology domain-containing protein n=1 Tax=Ficus carica TaxID=3494 RepID=A0AA87YZL6_FICCA|nr:hypothetical protein TIFTF001_000974 [Ficus carica]